MSAATIEREKPPVDDGRHVDFRMNGPIPFKVWCHRDWRDVIKAQNGQWYCAYCTADISHRLSVGS